ncbi:hypothetical protein NHONHO_75 [Mycobacterium phage Nhonho]|uniref:hypothetical protein n=1 Tax=Mycobacterium phage Nhonho TaxID=1675553 RepID=UPI0006A2B909|nr:hypothetical protein NHONHO_75 [Mycobacterium phage Nhonho]AKU45471.1 hypothetical protein NHONHO_75 [Mycobacterium phage Nhonho]
MSGEWFETEYGAMHHSDNWQLVAKTSGSYDLYQFERGENPFWFKILNTDLETAKVYVEFVEREDVDA